MACTSVRKFSVRKATWISFRARPQGGLGFRGRELGHTEPASMHFGLKDRLYLAISERWRREEGGRESDPPAPGEGMNR